MRYWPHPPLFLLVLLAAGAVAIAVVEIRAVSYAFTLTGLTPVAAAAVLGASVLGSGINIPVARIESRRLVDVQIAQVRAFGVIYLVPVGVPGHTTIAVNVGGAVVPTLVSAYLVWRDRQWLEIALAVGVVALMVHFAARPVESVGIAVSAFIPAVSATATALVLRPPGADSAGAAGAVGVVAAAPLLAYVAGTLGTLIGADLTHLGWTRQMAAPVVSIGGAGTFDGVFVSGVLAVLLAGFW